LEVSTSQAGEIHVVQVIGDVTPADVMPLAQEIQGVLNAKGLNIVLDLERVGPMCDAAVGAVQELARKLGGVGGALVLAGADSGDFGDHFATLKADPNLILADSRGHGMSLLLNRISVRGELLGYIRDSLATTYVSPTSPQQPVVCRFVKHLQNFLVYALEPPYDGSLQRGMTLRFTMTGCGEDGTRTVSYDGLIYKFATLKDQTPCLVIKVPDLLEVEEDRREDPRIQVQYQMQFYAKVSPDRRSYGTVVDISENGLSFTANASDLREGQLVMVVPDFKRFKLKEPIQLEVTYIATQGGVVKIGGRFDYINAQDQNAISRMVLDTSKW
jgi:hypothetical protein